MTITSWFMDDDVETDQRCAHIRQPAESSQVSLEVLEKLVIDI